jgi:hypothetical protein
MPEKSTLQRARQKRRAGKSPSTQAGEFVREEMHHVREGKHGARSREQVVAIGLSKARRAGVDLPPPEPGTTSAATRRKAKADVAKGRAATRKRTATRRSSKRSKPGSKRAATPTPRPRRAASKATPRKRTRRRASTRQSTRRPARRASR